MNNRLFVGIFGLALVAAHAHAQIFYPMVYRTTPCAVAVGREAECEVQFALGSTGAFQVIVSGTGVQAEVVSPKADPKTKVTIPLAKEVNVRVRFKVAPDATLGIREFRVFMPHGPSSLGLIVVVRDPVVNETEPNDSLAQAQAVSLPATLCGTISPKENVDFFKFKVGAGQAWTFHMTCQRLSIKLTTHTTHGDPMLVLRNAAGTVLAMNDNTFAADPLLHYRFATAGEYYLEVRDVRYSGYRLWEYAIEAHDRPFVTGVVPSTLQPGKTTPVRLVGYGIPADASVSLTIPSSMTAGEHWVSLPAFNGQPLNSVKINVNPLPSVLEAHAPNDTPLQAQPVTLPVVVNGSLERAGDVDCYAFEAKKGERFTLGITARSLQSELDSCIRIIDAKGETVAENDDYTDKTGHHDVRNEMMTADSRLEAWEAPADGRYVVEVKDLQNRGGQRFFYSLEMRRSRPHFLLELTMDKTTLAPDMTGVIFVRSFRKEGFTGAIRLAVEGLPAGVKAQCGPIPAGCQDGCILLRAEGVASGTFANIRIVGTADQAKGEPVLTAVARSMQELMVDGGGRYLVPVEMHTLAVVEQLDLKSVRIQPGELTIRPGESKTVEVTIARRPGCKEAVTLSVASAMHVWTYGNCLPPGVTLDQSASRLRIVGDQVKGSVVLKAAADAKPVRRQMVPVMGEVAFSLAIRIYYAGDPLWLTVEGKGK